MNNKLTRLQMFEFCALNSPSVIDGAWYDDFAIKLYERPCNDSAGIGRTELPVRSMLGLPLESPGSRSTLDINEPGFEGEIKDVQSSKIVDSKNRKMNNVNSIKLNKCGKIAFSCFRNECFPFTGSLSSEQVVAITSGNMNNAIIESLPQMVNDLFRKMTLPSLVMRDIPRMYLGGRRCFLSVERKDYDKAFAIANVTLDGTLKYKILTSYLKERRDAIASAPDFKSRAVPQKVKQAIKAKMFGTSRLVEIDSEIHVECDGDSYKFSLTVVNGKIKMATLA